MNNSEHIKQILSFIMWLMDACKSDEKNIVVPDATIEMSEI